MKTTLKVMALIFAVSGAARAQVAPAATGPVGMGAPGKVHYALRYSETAQFSNAIGNLQTSSASGSADYENGNQRYPFAFNYGGGYTWTLTGPSYETGLFQRLLLSQGIVGRKWRLDASDDVSYLPQTPITGFAGIPGIGEPIGVTNPTPSTSQSILVLNTHIVDNIAQGELEHSFSAGTSVAGGGSSEILRFPDGNGLNSDAETGNGQLQKRLNGRNSLSGRYIYSRFTYPDFGVDFGTQTAMFGYQRQWSRTITSTVSAGPEWISSNVPTAVPSSTNVSVNASLGYLLRFTSASLSYTRGVNGGAGYLIGGEVDSAQGNLQRGFGPNLVLGFTVGYQRTSGLNGSSTNPVPALNTTGVTDATFGGAQGTWRIGENFIVFANYTGTDQWSTSSLPTSALSQFQQILGFGVGYSPRVGHIRQ